MYYTSVMAKLFITLASLSGMTAVMLGAFGAHALRGRLDTVATELSAPFIRGLHHPVFSPDEAATHLLNVLDELSPEDNGGFFAWDGEAIPW